MKTLVEEVFSLNESKNTSYPDYIYGYPFTLVEEFSTYTQPLLNPVTAFFYLSPEKIKNKELGVNVRPTTSINSGSRLYFLTEEDAENFNKKYFSSVKGLKVHTGKIDKKYPAIKISKDSSIPIYCLVQSIDKKYLSMPHYKYIKDKIKSTNLDFIGSERQKLLVDIRTKAYTLGENFINNLNKKIKKETTSQKGFVKFGLFSSYDLCQQLLKSFKGKTPETRTKELTIKNTVLFNLNKLGIGKQGMMQAYSFSFNLILDINVDTEEIVTTKGYGYGDLEDFLNQLINCYLVHNKLDDYTQGFLLIPLRLVDYSIAELTEKIILEFNFDNLSIVNGDLIELQECIEEILYIGKTLNTQKVKDMLDYEFGTEEIE